LRYLADSKDKSPSQGLEKAELERVLAAAIERMPSIERTVLSLYYYEQMTLREVSGVVRLHESRVSQLKSQALLRLRAILQKRWFGATEGLNP
jgi:RNA polymerase sigma factor for flagellar operon FliA